MQRIVLVCAAVSLGIFASPVAAQQADNGSPPAAPASPAPDAYQLPPPPPFPPMPKTDPHHRWVDTGSHRSATKHHSAARTHHQASTAHHSKARASHSKARAHQAKTRVHHPTTHAPKVHLSRKTIRQCHAMSYKQIMKHSNCRALMRQELAAADHQRASAHRQKAKTTRHHSTKRRKK